LYLADHRLQSGNLRRRLVLP